MIYAGLYIDESPGRGRGVFTAQALDAGMLVETSPVIVMSKEERYLLDQTLLHDYLFEWGTGPNQCCLALGYVSVYNHSPDANCDYEMDYEKALIRIKTVRPVQAGEELFINYNGDGNNEKSLWFTVK
jgi:hypothetical protein